MTRVLPIGEGWHVAGLGQMGDNPAPGKRPIGKNKKRRYSDEFGAFGMHEGFAPLQGDVTSARGAEKNKNALKQMNQTACVSRGYTGRFGMA